MRISWTWWPSYKLLNLRAAAHHYVYILFTLKISTEKNCSFVPDQVTAGAWMHLLCSVMAVWLMPMSSLICIDIIASCTDQDFPASGCTARVTALSWNRSPGRTEACIAGCRDFLLEPHMFGCPSVVYY